MPILSRLGTRDFLDGSSASAVRAEDQILIDNKMELGTDEEQPAGQDELRQMIVDFVGQDFRNRWVESRPLLYVTFFIFEWCADRCETPFVYSSELALLWLYEEWYNDRVHSSDDPSYQPSYDQWLSRLIYSIRSKLYPKMAEDATYEKFLMDIPELSDEAIEFTKA